MKYRLSMNAKLLRGIQIVNVIAMIAFVPIGFYVLIFALSSIVDTHSLSKMVVIGFGYLLAIVAGLLSFKKSSWWLAVSLVGWGIVCFGQYGYEDHVGQKRDQEVLCRSLRQEPRCTEDMNGSISCTGSLASISADCKDIPK